MKRQNRGLRAGFTLVEIALAIGILAFACVPMVALLPSGAGNFRGAMNLVVTTQIAQRVINDCQQSDFDLLVDRQHLPKESLTGFTFRAPLLLQPAVRYFDEQGTEIIPDNPQALSGPERHRVIYEVNTRIEPQMAVPSSPQPAGSAGGTDLQPNLALVTVQVAFTAGYRDLPISSANADDATAPDRNLFKPPAGIPVYTYAACVGRGL